MRFKSSRTIITLPKDGGIVIYNFLTRATVFGSLDTLYWLSCLENWTNTETLELNHSHIDATTIAAELNTLAELGVVLQEHSAAARREEEYINSWEWGLAAGLFHFSVLNNEFAEPQEGQSRQLERSLTELPPSLYWQNAPDAVSLPRAASSSSCADLLDLMARRRTNRTLGYASIDNAQLADCLYAGLGITGHVRTPTGLLPLSMTPSGGARNPFEGFVLASNVTGLAPGFYHYSALQNSLSLINNDIPNCCSALLANQEWAEEMPAIIFLVAVFERTMWKYADPNAYRVILIEAGHIGQNVMLAATSHGLSACPTAALDHDMISRCLGLGKITHSPIYALTLSIPGDYDSQILALQ